MKKLIKTAIFLPVFVLQINFVHAQTLDSLENMIKDLGNYLLYRNHDTTYISNYGKEVAVKLVVLNKYNYFRTMDRYHHTSLRYRPLRDLSIGAGVSYKIFALDITVSLKLNDKAAFKDLRAFDFQGRIFSSKQYISGTLQYYMGYELSKVKGTNIGPSESTKYRDDLRIINFGLQYLYAFNYTRFSLKAPFVFNEAQLKSAGSVIAGASFSTLSMDADSSIVPPELRVFFSPDIYLTDLNIMSLAVNAGYMYTFVFKKNLFLTLSIIPGLNFNTGDYRAQGQNRNFIDANFNFRLISMNAFGYNGRRVFTGFQYMLDSYYAGIQKKLKTQLGYGKLSLFVGYRFGKR